MDGVKSVEVRKLINTIQKPFKPFIYFQISLNEKEARIKCDSTKTTEQAVIDRHAPNGGQTGNLGFGYSRYLKCMILF